MDTQTTASRVKMQQSLAGKPSSQDSEIYVTIKSVGGRWRSIDPGLSSEFNTLTCTGDFNINHLEVIQQKPTFSDRNF